MRASEGLHASLVHRDLPRTPLLINDLMDPQINLANQD